MLHSRSQLLYTKNLHTTRAHTRMNQISNLGVYTYILELRDIKGSKTISFVGTQQLLRDNNHVHCRHTELITHALCKSRCYQIRSSVAYVHHDLREDSVSRPTRIESVGSRRVNFHVELIDFNSKPMAEDAVALTIPSDDRFIFPINMPNT